MPETQFATTLIVCLKAGVALLVSAGTVLRRWNTGPLQVGFGPFQAIASIPAKNLMKERIDFSLSSRNPHSSCSLSHLSCKSLPKSCVGRE